MGLFDSSKKTYVSSTVYNLAGDIDERPNFLQTTLIGSVLQDSSHRYSLGSKIVENHLNGPGIDQRKLYYWALKNYKMGLPDATVDGRYNVNTHIVSNHIAKDIDESIVLKASFIDSADFMFWAEKHILENKPDLYKTNWTADVDPPNNRLTIQYEDGSTELVRLRGYKKNKSYLIAYYYVVKGQSVEPVVYGERIKGIRNEADLPDVSSFLLESDVLQSTKTITLTETTEVVKDYADGRPSTTSTSSTTSQSTREHRKKTYTKTRYIGKTESENGTTTRDIWQYIWDRHAVTESVSTSQRTYAEDGTTVTETTTVTSESDVPEWQHQRDKQDTLSGKVMGGLRLFMYEIGSGNAALDALENTNKATLPEFMPAIPLRLDNKFVNEEPYVNSTYIKANQAYRKATGNKNIEELIDSLKDNPSLEDIDFVFMTYGVPLNTKENSARRYLYEFLKNMMQYQETTELQFQNWITYKNNAEAQNQAWRDWRAAQKDEAHPDYGAPEPTRVSIQPPDVTHIQLKSNDYRMRHYDQRLSWITISEDLLPGKGKVGAKRGDVWLKKGTPESWNEVLDSGWEDNQDYTVGKSIQTLEVYYQVDNNNYYRLNVRGLVHRNFVYDGKFVHTDTDEALDAVDESGFIVPIHIPTTMNMSLVDVTQMTTANSLLVINSYEIVTTKWYQKGWFKIFVTIVVVVVAAVVAGPAGLGVLGTNAAVGASLGFAGTAALIAGAIANALAAMVLTSIIMKGSTELFGDKTGAIIGAIASYLTVSYLSTGSVVPGWNEMSKADQLIKITEVTAQAYSGWTQANIEGIQQEILDMQQTYTEESKEISELSDDIFGQYGNIIDPMMFTEFAEANARVPESSDTFLLRTLLTGTDIVELTTGMITDFAEKTLELPKPYH